MKPTKINLKAKNKLKLALSLFAFGSLAALDVNAADVGVNEIMEKTQKISYYQGKDGKAQILMKVYKSKGAKPIKKMFYMLRQDIKDGGEQMFLTYFTSPSDLKRTTFLVHKKINSDDYRRLYIPALDKVLAIAGSRKQDPFMGSDFSYEDVSGRHFSKDNHKLLGKEKLNGQEVYLVESTPKVKEAKTSKLKSWISVADYTPLKVQYVDHSGKVYREYTAGKTIEVQGYKTVIKRTMKSPLSGSYTEMLLNPKKVSYDIGLSKSDFTERSLKKPPMKYLK